MKKRNQSHAVRVKRTIDEKGAAIVQVPVYGAHAYAKNVNSPVTPAVRSVLDRALEALQEEAEVCAALGRVDSWRDE